MIGRRTFLKLGVAGAAVATVAVIGKKLGYLDILPVSPLTGDEKQLVTIYIELLAPPDQFSPGAVELGIHNKILENAANTKSFRRLLKKGSRWLDVQASSLGATGFLALDQGRRLQLIARSEAADDRSIEHRLYMGLRNRTFHHYYARPESWQGLCITHPPQPLGYPDYAQPPDPCA